jgi:hypothetical protein
MAPPARSARNQQAFNAVISLTNGLYFEIEQMIAEDEEKERKPESEAHQKLLTVARHLDRSELGDLQD